MGKRPLAALPAALLLAAPALAQPNPDAAPPEPAVAPMPVTTSIPEAQVPPGPGDPLPPLSMTYERARMNGSKGTLEKGVVTWGDMRLEADFIEYDAETQRLLARGNVRVTRGDERFSGASLLFDPENGIGIGENAVAVSPPFYVSGERIERVPTGIVAQNAMITPCPRGQGELKITAKQIEVVDDRYVVLRRPTFHLFGARILTLPRYRFVVRRGRGRERDEYAFAVPIHVRSSKISGLVVGTSLDYSLGKGYKGNITVDVPSKRPLQYRVTLQRDLIGEQRLPPERSPFADPTRRAEAGSPLRSLITARPAPPKLDPVLDYEDILPAANPVEFPSLAATRELRATVTVQRNEEVGNKRTSELLLSRLPEARISGRIPLTGTPPPGDQITRAYLRRPRPVITGSLMAGHYEERELEAEQRSVSHSRTAGTIGLGMLPLLLGDNLLVRPEVLYTVQRYSDNQQYRILETNISAEYIFGLRSAIGGSYITRSTSGSTPFTFDVVETNNEAQARAQTAFGRYTLGFLTRYDIDTSQFFDYQFGLGIRLNCLEPRFTYQRLGKQIGFSLVIPGLTAF